MPPPEGTYQGLLLDIGGVVHRTSMHLAGRLAETEPALRPVLDRIGGLGTAAEAPLVIGLWLWMAWANGKGKNRGRVALAVFFGLDSLAVLAALSQDAITYAPPDIAVGMVQCLVALTVVFLVFNPASSRHYRTSMRNTSSLA